MNSSTLSPADTALQQMTKDELLTLLAKPGSDAEDDHFDAEAALLAYVNDPEISAAWSAAARHWWYA